MHNILAILIASEFISEDREQQKHLLLFLKCVYTDNVENINMNIAEMSVCKRESSLFMYDITHFKSKDKLKNIPARATYKNISLVYYYSLR